MPSAGATLAPITAPSSDGSLLLTNSQSETLNLNNYPSRAAHEFAQAYDWADQAAIEACISVHYTNSAQAAALGRWCDSLGISRTMGRHQLLRILYFTRDHRLTQVEVAGEMQVTSANVTFLVDGLEKDELVRRVPSRSDRRTVYVELTKTGLEFMERTMPSFGHFAAAMFEGFSDGEKRQLSKLLDRLRRNAERFETRTLD